MDLILVQTVQLKPMIIAHSSVRMVSSYLSDVVIASVHSEKEVDDDDDDENDDDDNDYIIARTMVFKRFPETVFRHEIETREVMVDFKFDALYIVEMLSGSLYWWVELGVPSYKSATALSDKWTSALIT